MSRWNEVARRLRRHLLFAAGASVSEIRARGLDTDIARDDDRYLSGKIEGDRICRPGKNPARAPCHTAMPATKKTGDTVSAGNGFVLALFPRGFQVIPLYVSGDASIVFGFALLAIFYASLRASSILLTTRPSADLMLYLMINPIKASYSMAPTMVVCALAGYLTARLFVGTPQRHCYASDDADWLSDRSRRQFQAGESISLLRIFPVFWPGLFKIAETGIVPAGRIVLGWLSWWESRRHCSQMPSMPEVLLRQRMGAIPDDLSAADDRCQYPLGLLHGPAIRLADPRGCVDCVDLSRAQRNWHKVGRARHGLESGGERGVLPDPPHF